MLTTSQRITLAFTISIIIMATLAFIAHRGLTQANAGYQNSNRLSAIDIAITSTLLSLNDTAYLSTVFLRTGDSKDMNNALESLELAQKTLLAGKLVARGAGRIKDLEEIEEKILQFKHNLINLQEHRTNAITTFTTRMQPAISAFEKQINLIVTIEYDAQNLDLLNGVAQLWPTFSLLDSTMTSFVETQDVADAKALEKEFTTLGNLVRDLEEYIFTDDSEIAYEELKQLYKNLYDTFNVLRPLISASRAANVNTEVNLQTVRGLAQEFTAAFSALRERRDVEFQTIRNTTQAQTLTVTIAGLLITMAFAAFILLSITNTFKKLSTYFIQIAKGDFHAKSGITEKGAIGAMIDGMQQIPDTLDGITRKSNELAESILRGHFRDRFNSSEYSGGFSALGDSINSLANTYTSILDAIPTPIMVCDTKHSITFLNTPAQTTVGGNKTQKQCFDVFGADACHTPNCFGTKCMNTKTALAGTTSAQLDGQVADLNVQAAPLFDQKGTIVAFIETFTDISELKNQERLITKTASEAAGIADRVASATEELSAQVEQTSRGTNNQKRQVESTASAMHEMNSTVLEVARNAGQTSTQTEETLRKAHDGAQLVDKVVHSINAVNNVANTLQSNMQELGIQADNIGSVMNTISDIADQTNLLALNAAIEAARAGDAGRGFAVVADEVRKLAEKTMNATHEVGQSISTIQSSIRVNISEVTNAVDSVTQATDLANSSGQALSEIVELVSSNSQLVSSIATGAEQQSATSDEINRALGEINTVVSEINSSMGQSSQAVEELSSMAQELRSLMSKLS